MRPTGADIPARLERVGVYRYCGHEHVNGSLAMPLFDVAGHVVEMYGRKIGKDLPAGMLLRLYLSGRRPGSFNRDALNRGAFEELIVREALIDVLTFCCAGLRNLRSAHGVGGDR